jgi:hypothetical protein
VDVSKVKTAIEGARAEVKKLVDTTVEAGKKDPRLFNALRSLGNTDLALEKALSRLDVAVKRTAPRQKKSKKKTA